MLERYICLDLNYAFARDPVQHHQGWHDVGKNPCIFFE